MWFIYAHCVAFDTFIYYIYMFFSIGEIWVVKFRIDLMNVGLKNIIILSFDRI